ncbi:acyl carrier protein [Erysipelothrix sp. HDW6A]|uniref:acyl carrier protein n=1 Tax=Erysipelothrix sp. HDW6A TaxID=2714928 RepID=UPI00140AEF74|nr:acyl carrier protein [Erysipelothrix sp. HDW6A]QIK57350.1 acyl carrier protein [Erysipelothrix sp. HDW6A]
MNEKIKEIVAEILDIEAADIKEDALILDDLGADSIAVMEIVMELEGEYDFEVPTEDIVSLKTVNDIVAYIESKN